MKQRPIIFNTEMVRAILDGRKTQTRRAINDGQLNLFKCAASIGECHYLDDDINPKSMGYYRQFCQFGEVGDQLWVRETFQGPLFDCERIHEYNEDNGKFEKPEYCVYRASDKCPEFFDSEYNLVCKWRPSIHMPRWAARIILEVTDVRVERVQDISERDAWAEGFDGYDDDVTGGKNGYSEFCEAWQSIYGEQSWQSNPWVWVIEFRVISTTGGAA